jgi:hypothetical protein
MVRTLGYDFGLAYFVSLGPAGLIPVLPELPALLELPALKELPALPELPEFPTLPALPE